MHLEETTLSSETIYQGRIISLTVDQVQLPNGSTAPREVVHHNGGVSILALDQEDNVLFVRQYRYPYHKVLLELPAGKLEPGEDPLACGKRELEEETGYMAHSLEPLAEIYPTPAYVTEVLRIYLAKDLHDSAQHLDDDEFLTVEKIPFSRAVEMCLEGEIHDAKTVTAILKYNEMRRKNGPCIGEPQ